MCGIVGIYNKKNIGKNMSEILRSAVNCFSHRGPDDTGFYIDDVYATAQTRLSIIDIEGGRQPVHNEDNTIWVSFNGEIFNYIELREELRRKGHTFYTKSDTEVLVHLYEEYGEGLFEKLNGQFAFTIWNTVEKELILARDRAGICPLFYTENDDGSFIYASEIKSILRFPGVEKEIDPAALNQLACYWVTVSPGTAFKYIQEVPPGYYIKVNDSGTMKNKYWSLEFPAENDYEFHSIDHYAKALKELLYESTMLRLRADVPVAAYLSGGLDSSVTTLIMHSNHAKDVVTFSVRFDDNRFDEGKYQRLIRKHLNANHIETSVGFKDISDIFPKIIWHTEKPLLRTAPAPMYFLSKLVRDNGIKVVMTGEGADEIFGGYNIFKEDKIRRFWARDPASFKRPLLLKKIYPYIFNAQKRGLHFWTNSFRKNLQAIDNPFYSHLIRWENGKHIRSFLNQDIQNDTSYEADLNGYIDRRITNWHPLSRSQYLEYQLFMTGYLLSSQGDRMLMANSVEGRYPFLDHRLIEFAATIPPLLKIYGLNEKYILKRAYRGMLPREIVSRPKQPYRAPIVKCFLGKDANDIYKEILSDGLIRKYNYFSADKVGRLIAKLSKNPDAYVSARDEMALVAVISTQLLHTIFIEGEIII